MYTGFLYSKHTQQQTAAVIPCCTAITMQYNSYAMQFLYHDDEIKAEERCNKLQYTSGLQLCNQKPSSANHMEFSWACL